MVCVVAPVDQRLPVAADEVRVMVVPGQNDDGPLMVGVAAAGFAVTRNGAELVEQPLASLTVTLYEPAVETVIDCVVAPVDQRLPVGEEELSVIGTPGQKAGGPVITGCGGAGLMVTGISFETTAAPPHSGVEVQTRNSAPVSKKSGPLMR